MLRNLNMLARAGTEKGTKRCLNLLIPFSYVTSAALSILLVSAGPAHAQTLFIDDFDDGLCASCYQEKEESSNRALDGGYRFIMDADESILEEASTQMLLESSLRPSDYWTTETGSASGIAVSPGSLKVGQVPEPSTLLLALAGMVGALGVTRRRGRSRRAQKPKDR